MNAQRLHSPLHDSFRPAGLWGHGVGIVATLYMMSNFLYPLRKRLRILSGVGRISDWLDFHTFVGFMSPLVIAFLFTSFGYLSVFAYIAACWVIVALAVGFFGPLTKGRTL